MAEEEESVSRASSPSALGSARSASAASLSPRSAGRRARVATQPPSISDGGSVADMDSSWVGPAASETDASQHLSAAPPRTPAQAQSASPSPAAQQVPPSTGCVLRSRCLLRVCACSRPFAQAFRSEDPGAPHQRGRRRSGLAGACRAVAPLSGRAADAHLPAPQQVPERASREPAAKQPPGPLAAGGGRRGRGGKRSVAHAVLDQGARRKCQSTCAHTCAPSCCASHAFPLLPAAPQPAVQAGRGVGRR